MCLNRVVEFTKKEVVYQIMFSLDAIHLLVARFCIFAVVVAHDVNDSSECLSETIQAYIPPRFVYSTRHLYTRHLAPQVNYQTFKRKNYLAGLLQPSNEIRSNSHAVASLPKWTRKRAPISN